MIFTHNNQVIIADPAKLNDTVIQCGTPENAAVLADTLRAMNPTAAQVRRTFCRVRDTFPSDFKGRIW